MSVAYQGIAGAFGHEACLAFLPGHQPIAKPSFGAVIQSVEAGDAEYGILPIENNEAGPVTEAQALIDGSSLAIVSEHWLAVRMHLLVLPDVQLAQVRVVESHPVALLQCTRTIAALGIPTEAAANTAVAAQQLRGRDRAVLASEAAAAAYGLTILRRDVHDRADNATRFAVLAREGR
jgi:prephenate dehydratase